MDSEQHRQLNFASRPNLQNSRKSTLLTAHSGRVARYRTRLQNKIETKQEQKRKQDYQKRGSGAGLSYLRQLCALPSVWLLTIVNQALCGSVQAIDLFQWLQFPKTSVEKDGWLVLFESTRNSVQGLPGCNSQLSYGAGRPTCLCTHPVQTR